MKIYHKEIIFQTKGEMDIIDLTKDVHKVVKQTNIREGLVNIFSIGSTSAISVMEYEPGLIKDLRNTLDRIIPRDIEYAHHLRWGDFNGHSHIRATMIKSSLTIPLINGELQLGTWQQIVFIELDVRPRNRRVVVSILGE